MTIREVLDRLGASEKFLARALREVQKVQRQIREAVIQEDEACDHGITSSRRSKRVPNLD